MGKDLFNPHLRKFSIRKLNVGVCSVLLSTLILLGTAAQVNADEATASSGQNEATRTDITNSTTTTFRKCDSISYTSARIYRYFSYSFT